MKPWVGFRKNSVKLTNLSQDWQKGECERGRASSHKLPAAGTEQEASLQILQTSTVNKGHSSAHRHLPTQVKCTWGWTCCWHGPATCGGSLKRPAQAGEGSSVSSGQESPGPRPLEHSEKGGVQNLEEQPLMRDRPDADQNKLLMPRS